ncbi:MAG TPA: DUF4367 domain-containing protein [Candidatus Onthomonas avicola]|nr:DUF4367 domain-containing protein [Candidatus Onthomonas avicola]
MQEHKKNGLPLEQLSTEELERLLRTPEGQEPDETLILQILEVIASRETDQPQPDIDAAWQSFQEDYQGQADAYAPPQTGAIPSDAPAPLPKPKTRRRVLRWTVAVLAAAVLLAGTASAMGFRWLDAIAAWGSETFRFVAAQSGEVTQNVPEDDPYAELRAAVAEYTDTPLIPTWAPEGTEQVGEVDLVSYTDGVRMQAVFQFEEKEFTIRVQYYFAIPSFDISAYQKDDTMISQYDLSGITHYLLSNNDVCGAVWVNGNNIVFVQGNMSLSELQEILKSVYEE